MKPFVTQIDLSRADLLRQGLEEQGFEVSKPPYTLFSGKKKAVTCTLYESGKLVVQGKEMGSFIEFFLEPQILGSFDYSYKGLTVDTTERIGVDESGKGDVFGPLCIAGVYAEGDGIKKLIDLGVCDSKKIKDSDILKIGKEIQKGFHHHIVRINPIKYNELYLKFNNLNRLLAWGHATVIENLLGDTGCSNVIIDQFANEGVVIAALKRKNMEIHLTQRHRAEEDVVVAAASILARKAFVEGLERLSEQYGIELPKGASTGLIVSVGKKFVAKHGEDALQNVGKLHFKTFAAIRGTS